MMVNSTAMRRSLIVFLQTSLLSMLALAPRCAAAEASADPTGYPMLFHLLPASYWVDGKLPPTAELEKSIDDFLPEGKIYLYREREEKPSVILDASLPGRVPPGKWLWIAEASGYVSTFSGSFTISDEMAADPGAAEKILVWPVVPACRVHLDEKANWKGVQRLDFVSFTHNVVYLLFPEDRDSLWIPAGHNLTYSTDNRGLQGMTDLGACRQFELVNVAPPEAPLADRQDFMVHLPPREDVNADTLNWDELIVAFERLRPGGPEELTLAPVGRLWAGGRWTLFFLGVPVAGNWNLVAHHPKLRSVFAPVDSVGGSARELPPQELKPRRDVTYSVDFKTKRPHEDAKIVAYYCGRAPRPPKGVTECASIVQKLPLHEGLHEYLLENLDDGLYLVDAAIDGERLFGLGSNVNLYLDPTGDQVSFLPVIPIHEMEIYGHILVSGEPVEGAINLIPPSKLSVESVDRFEMPRSFPTDPDLLYHLYFFGRIHWSEHFSPEEGAAEMVRGLYPGSEKVQACSADGFCRTYNFHSTFAGEGRLDFEIDTGRKLIVEVTDDEDAQAIVDAWVLVRDTTNVIDFDHGEVRFIDPPGAEATLYFTDAEGRAYLRLPEELQEPMSVRKTGYQSFRGLPPAGAEVLEVSLEKDVEKPAASGIRVVFADDGQPVSQGYFLLIREDGTRDFRCSKATSHDGTVWFSDGCLGIGTAVFLHPGALIRIFNQRLLSLVPEVRVERALARPLVLRVTDADAQPVAGLAVGLRFTTVTVTPNDLLFAAGRTASRIYFRTDGDGHLVLRNVSPDASDVPTIFAAFGDYTGSASLADAFDGVVDLVVE